MTPIEEQQSMQDYVLKAYRAWQQRNALPREGPPVPLSLKGSVAPQVTSPQQGPLYQPYLTPQMPQQGPLYQPYMTTP